MNKIVRRVSTATIFISIILLAVGYSTISEAEELGIIGILYTILRSFILEGEIEYFHGSLLIMIGSFLAPLSIATSIILSLFKSGQRIFDYFTIKFLLKDHIIVAGDSLDCVQLISSTNTERKILFFTNDKSSIPSYIKDRKNIYLIEGDLEEKSNWNHSSVHRASSIILSLNDLSKANYICETIYNLSKKRNSIIFVGVNSSTEYKVLSSSNNAITTIRSLQKRLKIFSMQKISSTSIIDKFFPHNFYTMDYLTENRIHLLFYGFNQMAENILLEAALSFIYPNTRKIAITLVLKESITFDLFLKRYPGFKDISDINIYMEDEFISIMRNKIKNPLKNMPQECFVFENSSWEILQTGRNIRRFLFLNYPDYSTIIPVVFLLPDSEGYPQLHKSLVGNFKILNLEVFEEADFVNIDRLLNVEEIIDSIAENIHNEYAALYSIAPWEELTEREKDFNRNSARHYSIKMACLGYKISEKSDPSSLKIGKISDRETEILAEIEHRRWLIEKYLDDYIEYDNSKDISKIKNIIRLHHDIKPFDQLSREDIEKDINTFKNIDKNLETALKGKSLVKISSRKQI